MCHIEHNEMQMIICMKLRPIGLEMCHIERSRDADWGFLFTVMSAPLDSLIGGREEPVAELR